MRNTQVLFRTSISNQKPWKETAKNSDKLNGGYNVWTDKLCQLLIWTQNNKKFPTNLRAWIRVHMNYFITSLVSSKGRTPSLLLFFYLDLMQPSLTRTYGRDKTTCISSGFIVIVNLCSLRQPLPLLLLDFRHPLIHLQLIDDPQWKSWDLHVQFLTTLAVTREGRGTSEGGARN